MSLKEAELPRERSEDTTVAGKDDIEEPLLCFQHVSGSLVRCLCTGLRFQHCRRDAGAKVLLPIGKTLQLPVRCHVVLMRVGDLLLSVFENLHCRECTGAMKVEIWNEMVAVEDIDPRSVWLGDVVIAHVLPDDRAVLRLRQSVVVTVSWAPLRLCCFPSLQE